MPEVLWKAYIDFEFSERELERVDALYERLLEKTNHVKVWISYALSKMAAALALEEDEDAEAEEEGLEIVLTEEKQAQRAAVHLEAANQTRQVFERGYKSLKEEGLKEERVVLLEAWKAFEAEHGDQTSLDTVQAKMPRITKQRRPVPNGIEGTTEEYYDLTFPEDEEQHKPSNKLLQMARAWHAQRTASEAL